MIILISFCVHSNPCILLWAKGLKQSTRNNKLLVTPNIFPRIIIYPFSMSNFRGFSNV